jgi:hypothetical protein
LIPPGWRAGLRSLYPTNPTPAKIPVEETMATIDESSDILADLEAVCNHKGIVREPELLKRIAERSAQVREDAYRKFGLQDLGVPIIREIRDGEWNMSLTHPSLLNGL